VAAYEAGLKGALAERRLSFAAAAFYSDYTDQQVTTQRPVAPPAVGIASVIDNAGASTIYGAEFEGRAILGDNLTADVSLGYLHARFDEFITRITGAPVDIAKTRAFQNAPRWSGFLGLTWRRDLLGGELKLTPAASYRAAYHLFDVADPLLDQKGYALLDLTLLWNAPGGRYTLGLSGRNLADARYRVSGYSFNAPAYNSSVIAYYGAPRTWAVSLQAKF
jgi:iron complex outermembrane receptor protein